MRLKRLPNFIKPDRIRRIIQKIGLFDASWYKSKYPDVAESGMDPLHHFIKYGVYEGRVPNEKLDVLWYRRASGSSKAKRAVTRRLKRLRVDAEPDCVTHPIQSSGLFDEKWYTLTYPDVLESGMAPLEHFLEYGVHEGRNPSDKFDTIWYLSENYEVQAAGINPLLHYIENKDVSLVTPKPLTEGQRFESFNRPARTGLLDGRRLFSQFSKVSFGSRLPTFPGTHSSLPLPPVELSARIGSPTLEGFEHIGREAKITIVRCLPPEFSFQGSRCLDFGCGIGRVIRHFEKEADVSEFWGCDIDGTSMQWCAENLSPPFRFFQLSDSPVLPFESSSFDMIYALGVFSQVFVDWQLLAMELRRILKPGGVLFMTFNGQTSFEEMFKMSYYDSLKHCGMYVNTPYQSWNKGGPNVGISPDWIKTYWGGMFDIDYIAMEGFMEYQSVCTMRKPRFGPPVASQAPTLHLGTSQDYNPDSVGKFDLCFDSSRPFRESYGIVGKGEIDVTGWIVFRRDVAVDLELAVDGVVAATSGAISNANENFRDWEAPPCGFCVRVDLTPFSRGLHEITLGVSSKTGLSHQMSVPLTVQ